MPEIHQTGPEELFLSSAEKLEKMRSILAGIQQSVVEIKDFPEQDVRKRFIIDEINSNMAELVIHYQTIPFGAFNVREHSIFALLNYQNCDNLESLLLNVTQALGVVEYKSERENTPVNNFHQISYLKIINLLQSFITQPSFEKLIELYKVTSSYLLTDLPQPFSPMQKQKYELCISFNIKLSEHIVEILNCGPGYMHTNSIYIMEGFWRTFNEFFRESGSKTDYGAN